MRSGLVVILASVLAGCSSAPPAGSKPETKAPVIEARGSVAGKVTFAGKRAAAKRIDISEEEECVKLNKGGLYDDSLVVKRDGSLANVLVYVKSALPLETYPAPVTPVVLDQKGCQFAPRVMAMRSGQLLRVTNSDPVTHNVHPVAQMNREWNQSQAPGEPPIERRFARPEIMIRVKCNVHNWMRSWVAVVSHPYYAVTGSDGSFDIPNVPVGDYTLEAWQESLGAQEQRVHIERAGTATVAFNFKADPKTK